MTISFKNFINDCQNAVEQEVARFVNINKNAVKNFNNSSEAAKTEIIARVALSALVGGLVLGTAGALLGGLGGGAVLLGVAGAGAVGYVAALYFANKKQSAISQLLPSRFHSMIHNTVKNVRDLNNKV